MTKYFEDFELGEKVEGQQSYELEAAEIIAFSGRWDPHAFHTDVDVAAATPVGKLFTSGLHLLAIAVRLGHVSAPEGTENAEIGLGYDQVRFFTPGCVGDRLHYSSFLSDMRPSKSKPHLGVITFTMMLHNQRDEKVLSCTTSALFRRRAEEPQTRA